MRSTIDELYWCYLNHSIFQNVSERNVTIANTAILDLESDKNRISSIMWPIQIGLSVMSSLVSFLNLAVLTRPVLMSSSPFNLFLVALELSNLVSALFQMCYFAIYVHFGKRVGIAWVYYLLTVSGSVFDITEFFTNWLTVVIGIWRLVAVVWPISYKFLITKCRAMVSMVIAAFVSCLMVPVYFAGWKISTESIKICANSGGTSFKTVLTYTMEPYQWVKQNPGTLVSLETPFVILNFFVPSVIFAVVTVRLVMVMVKARSTVRCMSVEPDTSGQTRTTVVLLVLLWCYLLSSATMGSFILYVLYGDANSLERTVINSTVYLPNLVTNSFSFFAYYLMGGKFRDTLHALLRWR